MRPIDADALKLIIGDVRFDPHEHPSVLAKELIDAAPTLEIEREQYGIGCTTGWLEGVAERKRLQAEIDKLQWIIEKYDVLATLLYAVPSSLQLADQYEKKSHD